ncbi:tyrosine-protein phosphatase [Gordonia sp. NPDC058843]|uniref:tyrosine-protein phosphatase n=1 Tax=Gordonia sp. NPDC058843 TaxID=3346648 RepID=UPI003683F175
MTRTFQDAGPAGLLGFRPVAGLRTTDGRRMAGRTLFRSATPQFVDQVDARAFVEELGLASIVDLRLADEAQREGSGGFTGAGVQIVNIPFAVRPTVSTGSAVAPMPGSDPLVNTYLIYLTAEVPFRRLVGRLVEPDALPALVHCTVGKDRTGVAVAIMLDAIGILRADIAQDYARRSGDVTTMMRRLRQMESYGNAVDVYPPEAYTSDPATILRFLSWVDLEHGGAREYLTRIGVTDAELNDLADHLLVPDEGETMSQINKAITVAASAEDAWRVVGDVAGVHRWVPAISATRMEGQVRVATFDGGEEARERILTHSDAERTYSYTYLDGPIPLEEYESRLSVAPHHDGDGALITWDATLVADPAVVRSVEELYDASLGELRALLDGRS